MNGFIKTILFFILATTLNFVVGCDEPTTPPPFGRVCITNEQCGVWNGYWVSCVEGYCAYPSDTNQVVNPDARTNDADTEPQCSEICDDGIWCNGAEACKNGLCVKVGIPPCGVGDIADSRCNEAYRECGSCAQRGAKWCDDGVPYTVDTCDHLVEGQAQCVYEIADGWCGIGAGGYEAGTFNPQNSCQVCDPDQDQEWWTTVPNCPLVVEMNDIEVVQPDTEDTPDTNDTEETFLDDTESEEVDEADIAPPIDVQEDLEEPNDTTNDEDVTEADTEDVVEDTADTVTEEDIDVPPVDPCEGVVCDDHNPCTDDACDPETGNCVALDNSATCDDHNPCTQDDVCADAECVSGTNVCDCETTAECLDKNDADLCNGTLVCENTKCVVDPTTIVVCEQSPDQCFEARCEPSSGLCYFIPLTGESCDDADHCTIDDVCVESGECAGSTPLVCDDHNICTDDSCNPTSGCQFSPNLLPCTDENECTLSDTCSGGTCLPGETLECSDGKPCNGLEVCDPGTGCVAGEPLVGCCQSLEDCADNSVCTDEVCSSSNTCVSTTKNCDDDDICTIDTCDPILGCGHAPLVCNDGQECTYDSCLDKSGIGCVFYDANGNPCTDDDACTTAEKCSGGSCSQSSAVNCDDNNPCTDDACDAITGCVYTPNSSPCEDGLPCSLADFCANSSCTSGDLKNCDDTNPCTMDACDPVSGLCVHPPKNCDDTVACTTDSCNIATGVCQHTRDDQYCADNPPKDCDIDVCDPVIGCAVTTGYEKSFYCSSEPDVDQDGQQRYGSDRDDDADGICDPEDVGNPVCTGSDNCPATKNAGQEDSDSDGIGDACDPHP